jgi:energy-coupling factor transporter ATP-binding protein EcfA2
MVDFLKIVTEFPRQGFVKILPDWNTVKRTDLMTRGKDFYAVWMEDRGYWSTNEEDVSNMVDNEIRKYKDEHSSLLEGNRVELMLMENSRSRVIKTWHTYCQNDLRDSFHNLDERLVFLNDKTAKKDYVSQKRLPYDLVPCDIPNYERLMSVIYDPEEREKIEWAIGSIVTGDSKKNQKFMVLYGAPGTGKSTVLNIIQKLFDGYYTAFNAKSLANSGNQFPLEPFKNGPLVAIQHDGDLSKIEDNTLLNSLVSHELLPVNEKGRSIYLNSFKCFIFMGTNKPVKITDAKSGILRRLIDVSPSGNKLSGAEYRTVMKGIDYELGGIACHCRDVYLSDPHKYDDYVPTNMMEASNDFYNFVLDSYFQFSEDNGVSLKDAWKMYRDYCDDAKVPYPMQERLFKLELRNYFDDFYDRYTLPDGTRIRSYFYGFNASKFENKGKTNNIVEPQTKETVIDFKEQESIFDSEMKDLPAQYANTNGTPNYNWDNVTTVLSDIDTHKLHYVRVPENHIVIDFDIPNENGEKDYEANLREASKWPKTYAELSKSGSGIHLHYIYAGDPSLLRSQFDDHIEIKVFTGKSSLRRKLTKCNDIPIATISSGLPLKGEKKVRNTETAKNEEHLRNKIIYYLQKKADPHTAPNFNYIVETLETAYNTPGLSYNLEDMRKSVAEFAAQSTHQADRCIKQLSRIHFKSKDLEDEDEENISSNSVEDNTKPIVFFDIEVFPNVCFVNWKFDGESEPVHRLINPSPKEIRELYQYNLIGYNNKHYDNHILKAIEQGYSNKGLFNLSQMMIKDKKGFLPGAWDISYSDVLEFLSVKQSLKKWEIELDGVLHHELGFDWDQPVPKEKWEEVAEYCDDDVIATEKVFHARQADWTARVILAYLAGGTVNDSTNGLTTKLIFGDERHPKLVYSDLELEFPGYKYEKGADGRWHNMYRGEDVGFGGYVFANPGMYGRTITFDVASMHPTSIIKLNLFGDYTKNFQELYEARIAIKHKDYKKAGKLFGGKLKRYLTDESMAKSLSAALKIAINSVYGLTSAKFDNPFRDPRNVNNIVALRGALFMVDLKHAVMDKGFNVVHIKTDSIKVENPTKELEDFIYDFGRRYGYEFEVEHDFEKICLVNDAVYIGKCTKDDPEIPGQWTATGAQFAVPYVFKKWFSKEPIILKDLRETKQVTTAMYLDFDEDLPEGEHKYQFVGKIGQFYPMISGVGAGRLCRQNGEKYDSVTGTKGYRWMEVEMVENLHLEDSIDKEYYEDLAHKAKLTISKFGDFEQFIDDSENTNTVLSEDPKEWFQEDSLPEEFEKICKGEI